MTTKEKLTQEEALAKIKALMSNHFENIGRKEFEDNDSVREELVEDIDEILSRTDISIKHLIVEKLKLDELRGNLERR